MNDSDIYTALKDLAQALSAAGVNYFIGGSIASSIHGEFRATNDINAICELNEHNIDDFIKTAKSSFIIDEIALRKAVTNKSTYNIIHESSLTKVDLFNSEGEFKQRELARASLFNLPASNIQVRIATAEDVILSKLVWYRKGNETSDRQWKDIESVVRVKGASLDLNYLRDCARQLKILDLLEKVIR